MKRAALGLLVASFLACRATPGVNGANGVEPKVASAGPIEQVAPPAAVFARDGAELTALLAQGPSEIWLSAKPYHGDFVIRRPLALRGLRGASLEGSGTGTVLRIEVNGASVDNIVVRGSGHKHTAEDGGIHAKGDGIAIRHVLSDGNLFGISLEACTHCLLEDSRVHGGENVIGMRGDGIKVWESHDSIIRRNRVEAVRDMVVWYSRRVTCEDNVVTASRYGTHFMYAHDGVVRGNRMVGNVVGIFSMYSARLRLEGNVLAGAHGAAGMGIGFKESDGIVVTGNSIVGNTAGIYLDRTPRSPLDPVTFERNQVAVNDLALRIHGAESGITFTGNDFTSNGSLVEIDGGGNALKMRFARNHWSEYDGYDLDGDGVGDVAFRFKRLSSEIAQEHPAVRLMQGTVAMGALDAIAHAFPLVASEPVLVDAEPVMRRLR